MIEIAGSIPSISCFSFFIFSQREAPSDFLQESPLAAAAEAVPPAAAVAVTTIVAAAAACKCVDKSTQTAVPHPLWARRSDFQGQLKQDHAMPMT